MLPIVITRCWIILYWYCCVFRDKKVQPNPTQDNEYNMLATHLPTPVLLNDPRIEAFTFWLHNTVLWYLWCMCVCVYVCVCVWQILYVQNTNYLYVWSTMVGGVFSYKAAAGDDDWQYCWSPDSCYLRHTTSSRSAHPLQVHQRRNSTSNISSVFYHFVDFSKAFSSQLGSSVAKS